MENVLQVVAYATTRGGRSLGLLWPTIFRDTCYETPILRELTSPRSRAPLVGTPPCAGWTDEEYTNFAPSGLEYEYDELGNLTKDRESKIHEIVWYPFGKVKRVIKDNDDDGVGDNKSRFLYGVGGNRIWKAVIASGANEASSNQDWNETLYVRDETGNVIATYDIGSEVSQNDPTELTNNWRVKEWFIYGSDREGVVRPGSDYVVSDSPTISGTIKDAVYQDPPLIDGLYIGTYTDFSFNQKSNTEDSYIRHNKVTGLKSFELKNHLGNVQTVISDRKRTVMQEVVGGDLGVVGDGIGGLGDLESIEAPYFLPEVQSVTDYYPFGSIMPGRSFASESYRYGFNGMEKDDEIKGVGNSLDFGARIYDSRLSRWLSVDPMASKFASFSPYVAMGNNPIFYIDVDGKYFTGNTKMVKKVYSVVSALAEKGDSRAIEFKAQLELMDASDIEFNINKVQFNGQAAHGVTTFDFDNNRVVLNVNDYHQDKGPLNTVSQAAHELVHGAQFMDGEIDFIGTDKGVGQGNSGDFYDEENAMEIQNKVYEETRGFKPPLSKEQKESQKLLYKDEPKEHRKSSKEQDDFYTKKTKYKYKSKHTYKPTIRQKSERKMILK